jgi:predicted HAD superfamily hydrolase
MLSNLSMIDNILRSSSYRIISFDIFDTVVYRDLAEPRGIFDHMADIISRQNLPIPRTLFHIFTSERMKAEKIVRAQSTKEDIPLSAIYRFLGHRFELLPGTIAKLKALEIKLELESVVGAPDVITFIRSARLAGKRIIFVSDMYLPRSVIIRMLQGVGAHEPQDGVYVSGEIGLTKASGRLFEHVLRHERCRPTGIVHIGDHPSSDHKVPASLGIRTMPYRRAHLTRYERVLLNAGRFRSRPTPDWQLLSGGSRKARLSGTHWPIEREAAIYEIGANVAGPIIFGFALWVLKQAASRNVKRLYFMARDGQVILDVAKKILPKLGYDIEPRYLYGSRQAWNLPSVANMDEDALKWITHVSPVLTVRLVALRLGIAPDDLMHHLRGAGFSVSDPEAALSPVEILELRRILQQAPSVRDLILDYADRARSALLDYLKQERLINGDSCALVDTGWFASSQTRLNRILRAVGVDRQIPGYYFGLRTARPEQDKFSFFFGPTSTPSYQEWGKAFISILEVLCSADHGMTLGYQPDADGRLQPRLKEPINRTAVDWGLEPLRRGIHAFVDSLPPKLHSIDTDEYRVRILGLIKTLISRPSHLEAELLGGFGFSGEQTEDSLSCLAPPLSVKTMVESLLDKSGVKRKAITFWPEASILRSSPLVCTLIPTRAIRPMMRLVGKVEKLVHS